MCELPTNRVCATLRVINKLNRMWKRESKISSTADIFTMVFSYQCGVDGLDLVLLKRSEARYLAAQVGVHQHLRLGKTNWLGLVTFRQETVSAWENSLSMRAHRPGGQSSYRIGDNWFFTRTNGSVPHFLECDPFAFAVWQTCCFRKMLVAFGETLMWQNDFDSIVSSCSAWFITQIKTLSKTFADEDKLYFVTHLRKLAIARDVHHPPHSPLSPPPTCSLTLCAASRLWTKPISVRYFIPDATPVSISISCITLSWPSCFWGYRRREERKQGDGKLGGKKKEERENRGRVECI